MGFGHQDDRFASITCYRDHAIPGITFRQGFEVGSPDGAGPGTFVASRLAQSLNLRLTLSSRLYLLSPFCQLTQLDTSLDHSTLPGSFSSSGL